METTETKLDRLCAGREFADYLIANGWQVISIENTLWNERKGFYDKVNFTRERIENDVPILYMLAYDGDEIRTQITCFRKSKGAYKLESEVFGHEIEEMPKFAFLCDAMGWVTMVEANTNCKQQTGISLFETIANEVRKNINSISN